MALDARTLTGEPERDLLDIYLNEIGRVKLQTHAELLETATRARRERGREAAHDPRQPSARRARGPRLPEPRPAVPGPDRGGEPGPDPRRGPVRARAGPAVQHVRLAVDPPGHPARAGRAVARGAHPGADVPAAQPLRARRARAPGAPWARA